MPRNWKNRPGDRPLPDISASDFLQVIGQEPIVRTLSNAIERDQIRQAYLFAGPRGTGKTSMARILAKSLNCLHGPTATPAAHAHLPLDHERHVS